MNTFRSSVLGGKKRAVANPLVTEKSGGATDGDDLTSVGIARDAIRSTNHRDDDRHRLDQETAAIIVKGKMLDAELINLSGGGAMIRAAVKPRLWQRIDLVLGEGQPIECAVRWLRDDRIGLEFAHETQIDCAPEQRDALLLDVIRRSFPDTVASRPAVAAPVAAPVAASRRSAARHPLIWSGEILFNHDRTKVRLRNISATGALIDTPTELPAGADVLLTLGAAGEIFANVGWSRGGQAGLVFATPFDVYSLVAVRPEVAEQAYERPTHLNPNANHAWAPEWERSALEELREELEGFMKR